MKKLVLAAVLALCFAVPVFADCGDLVIMGYPKSCVTACAHHGMSAYDNFSCMVDIVINW